MHNKTLAVCAMFENEARYLPEWLAYHRLVGVAEFVLYDNGSTDDPALAIRSSPFAEHVTLIHWRQRPGQLAAYKHFIEIFAPGFDWVAFLDVDQFLLPLGSGKIVDTLESLNHAAAVLVHRRVYGPGTWQEPPPGLVVENYDRRAPDDDPANNHVTTIARCSELLGVTDNPHEFRINGPVFNTAGHLAPNNAIQVQPCYRNLVVNHYYTRSRQDWLARLQRASTAADATTRLDEPELFDRLAAVCQVRDATIQSFAAAVRGLLGLEAAGSPPPDPISPGPMLPEAVPPATVVAEAVALAIAAPEMVTLATGVPETVALASAAPETVTLASAAPETATLASATPETATLASATPEILALASAAPEMVALATAAPETVVLAMGAPETATLATAAPETWAPETLGSGIVAPGTVVRDTGAAVVAASAALAPTPEFPRNEFPDPMVQATALRAEFAALVGPGEVTASSAAQTPPTTDAPGPTSGPRAERGDTLAPAPSQALPAWLPRGQDAQERAGGLGLVFRDRSRAGEHWLAALRGAAVAAIDPAFLHDEYDRIRDFPTAAEARAACDAALAQEARH